MSSTTTTEQTALAVPDERAELAAELYQDPNRERLDFPAWYLSVLGECDAAELRLKQTFDKIKAQIDARRKALEWRFGKDFRARVEGDLANQKSGKAKKSITYLAGGKAGFRKTTGKLHFLDAEALTRWCTENLPAAIKFSVSATAVREYIQQTGDIPPGAEWEPPHDKFYPTVDQPQLEEDGDG